MEFSKDVKTRPLPLEEDEEQRLRRENMERKHWIIAISTAIIVILGLSQFISVFGVPELNLWQWKTDPASFRWTDAEPTSLRDTAAAAAAGDGDVYLLGVGKADITGPVVEINLMGYANSSQVGSGLRQRLFARAFIVGDANKPSDRFVYLVLDTQSGDTAVRYGVLDGLAKLGGDYAMYSQKNVALTGTHSHSGPGAWLNYLLPQITSKGFDKQSYQAIVDGTILAIKRAHQSVSPGRLKYGETSIQNANINRSPYAYLANPEAERARYTDDVDKTLSMLRFQRTDGTPIGVLTWFPVHGTSMLGNNTLVSGDNKGVAAHLFEKAVGGNFVAGFSQSNVGDTSPNTEGAWCEDGSNQMCNFHDSTCGGKSQPCHGRGPAFRKKDNGASSCFEIGRRQFEGAKALFDSLDTTGTPIADSSVSSLHSFKDLTNYSFILPNGTKVSTCYASLGYSFAAGTTDGPGAFDFKQNDSGKPNANPVWAVVGGLLHDPPPAQRACQAPKPILLDVGAVKMPYDWTPNIVDIQLLRVGQFVAIIAPGEATTMSGRRWKEAVAAESAALVANTNTPPIVVLGGPANTYAHYIATEEEYGIQRYEGASTLYGPHTLNAYINLTLSYLPYLLSHPTTGTPLPAAPPAGPNPPNNVAKSLSFITGVVYDNPPLFKSFGAVLTAPAKSYPLGTLATAKFAAANPRNNLRLEGTFAAVEQLAADGKTWNVVRDDSDWSLIFRWKRTNEVMGMSEVALEWETDAKGTFRFRYYGDAKKPVTGKISAFEGVSGSFTVV